MTLTVSALSLQQVLASPGGVTSLRALLLQLQSYLASTMLPHTSNATATTAAGTGSTAAALSISLSYVKDRRTGAVLAVNESHAVNAGLTSGGGSTGTSSGSATSGGAAVAAARLLQTASDSLELGVAMALQPASDAPLPAASDVQSRVQTALQAPAAATYLQTGSVAAAVAVGAVPTSVSATVTAVSAQAPATPADTSANTGTGGASTGAGSDGGGANVGAVAGGIVVAIAVVGGAIAAALYMRRGRGDKRKSVLTASSRKSLSQSGAVIMTEPDTGNSGSGAGRGNGARKYSVMTSTANPLAAAAGPGSAQTAGGRLPSSRGVSAFEPTQSREYERV
jgi:hypothetical protein